MREKTTLSSKQREVLQLLALGNSPAAAATTAGVARGTVYRWMGQEAFSHALRELDADLLRRLGRRVVSLGDLAAKALKDGLAEDEPMGHRLRAADLVTARGPQLAELTQVIERLEALEKRLNANANLESAGAFGAGRADA